MDTSNAFNSLNREAALHNIRHVCPSLATVLINTHRNATELFVDGSTLLSEEGTMGCNQLAMAMYAMPNVPLITHLGNVADLKQAWYADDAMATGSLHSARQWWNHLVMVGPAFWLLCQHFQTMATYEGRSSNLDQAKSLFQDTQVNITINERPHLLLLAPQSTSNSSSLTRSTVGYKNYSDLGYQNYSFQVILPNRSLTPLMQLSPMAMCTSSHSCAGPSLTLKVTFTHSELYSHEVRPFPNRQISL